MPDTYNSFANQRVDELVIDHEQQAMFFPDNCQVKPGVPCLSGVHVFNAVTGAALPKGVINVGFRPMEVAVSR